MNRRVFKLTVLSVCLCCITLEVFSSDLVSPMADNESSSSISILESKRLFFSVDERRAPSETLAEPAPLFEAPAVKKVVKPERPKPKIHYQAVIVSAAGIRVIINGLPCNTVPPVAIQGKHMDANIVCMAGTPKDMKIRMLSGTRSLEVTGASGLSGVLKPGESL